MNRRDERETAMNLGATDRITGGQWELYSDDGPMIAKLKRAGYQPYKRAGAGWFFRLPVAAVSFRKPRAGGDGGQE